MLPTRFENTPIVIFAEQYAIIGIIAAVVKYMYAHPGVRMTSKKLFAHKRAESRAV